MGSNGATAGPGDFVKVRSKPGVDPWRLFTGDDLCYPVEMFVHIMEYKIGLDESGAAGDDEKMAADVLGHIPDAREEAGGADSTAGPSTNSPAAAWKSKIVKRSQEAGTGSKWSEIKPELLDEFGSKTEYSLKEKLHILQSIGKGPYEDSQAYLIRIRCVVSLLVNNKIYSNLDELPSPSDIWVRVLFLFGLDEMEQNLVIEESDLKTLDELCKVLALPEVKMIRRADDMMNKDFEEGPEPLPPPRKKMKKGKKKRKIKYDDYEDDEVVKEEADLIYDNMEEDPDYSPTDNVLVKQEVAEDDLDEDFGDNDHDSDSDYKPDVGVPEVQMDEPSGSSSGKKTTKKATGPKKLWSCCFCDVSPFKSRSDLWLHQDEEHEGNKAKCDACDLKFQKVSELSTHNNQIHPQEAKSRRYKKYVFEQINAQMKEASEQESADKPYKIQGTLIIKGAKGKAVAYVCGICKHQAYSQIDMAKHTRELHNGRRYKCFFCDFKSKGRDEMGAHLLSIHDFEAAEVKVFRCTYPECKFKAISACKVKDHVDALHLRLLQFSCEICGKQFRYKGALQSHQKDHHPEDAKKLKLPLKPKYNCQDCDQVFTAPCYLKLHREKKHRNGRPPDHLCPRCGRAFKLEIYLKRHLKEFHDRDGDKPCPYCPPSDKKPTKLYSRASLYQHIQGIHNRNLVCGLCHLAFSSLSLMIVHYRLTHLKYKQYRCKECNIKFSRTSNIRDHIMRKHFDGDFQPTFEYFRDNPIVEDYKKTDPAGYPTKDQILAQMSIDSEKGGEHKYGPHHQQHPSQAQPQPAPGPPQPHVLEKKYSTDTKFLEKQFQEQKFLNPHPAAAAAVLNYGLEHKYSDLQPKFGEHK